MKRLLQLLCFLALLTGTSAWAACTGSSPSWSSTADRTSVATCVSNASSGDTITVASGSATWTSQIVLPSNKDLTLVGATTITCTGTPGTATYACTAGATNTTLTCASGCFYVDMGASHTITGFTMTNAATAEIITVGGSVNTAKHFRIYGNRLISTNGWNPSRVGWDNATGNHPQGIWHNNRLEDVAIHTNGSLMQLSEGNYQHQIWAQATALGSGTGVVFLEDNHFYSTSTSDSPGNFTDGNYGGRSVIRFNRTEGGYANAWEYHSPQGANRGYQRWENYHNAVTDLDTNDKCYHGYSNLRGGTGVMFNNTLTGTISGCNFDMILDNVRSTWAAGTTVDGVRACDGASPWDQNTTGQTGWHCRDQLGTARDYSQWNHTTTPAWNQELKPAYFWNNTRAGSEFDPLIAPDERNDSHIQWNRDVYKKLGASCSGSACTSGVGTGTKAQLTALTSCTAGVAFWVTDEGYWNSRTPGTASGVLYKCTATNTWTLYYVPYPYPHPWRSGLTAPTGLTVQ